MHELFDATVHAIRSIELQPEQSTERTLFENDDCYILLREFPAMTLFDGQHFVAAAGLVEIRPGTGYAWALLGRRLTPSGLVIASKYCRTMLNVAPFRRIEATARCDFGPAQRWLRLLGFEVEAPRMRAYLPDGGDATLYSKVKT